MILFKFIIIIIIIKNNFWNESFESLVHICFCFLLLAVFLCLIFILFTGLLLLFIYFFTFDLHFNSVLGFWEREMEHARQIDEQLQPSSCGWIQPTATKVTKSKRLKSQEQSQRVKKSRKREREKERANHRILYQIWMKWEDVHPPITRPLDNLDIITLL